MQYPLAIVSIVLVLSTSACKSPKTDDPAAVQAPNNNRVAKAVVVGPNEAANQPIARPANVLNGRIVGVRDNLRFVIVDFANSRLPQLDQQLHVYRLDQKVAVLKVSGPYLGTTVAADITAGDAQMGDMVRDR